MQVFFLPTLETVFVDILAWLFIHLGIGYWTSQLPITRFDPNAALYQTYAWEKNGEIYDRLFRVRSWKKFIPCGGKLYPNTFSLQNLADLDVHYLTTWLKESCRAEFCHWLMILPGFLFFFWNSVTVGWWMVVYAVSNNLVPIIMQRFNRPRIRRMLQFVQKNSNHSLPINLAREQANEKEMVNSYC